VAALAIGGYVFLGRSGHFEPAADKMIESPFPPAHSRSGLTPRPPGPGAFPPGAIVREQAVVDLNTASLTEIETLPGITPDYARKIIAGRPYQKIDDLTRAGIPRQIVEEISPPAVIRLTERGSPPPSVPRRNKP
jgi:hypothetical protein